MNLIDRDLLVERLKNGEDLDRILEDLPVIDPTSDAITELDRFVSTLQRAGFSKREVKARVKRILKITEAKE